MSEIKFRAWDKKNKTMHSVTGLHFFEGGSLSEVSVDSDGGELQNIPTDRLQVMQYTGLKDKNGKEIYEGDILKTKDTRYELGYRLDTVEYTLTKYTSAFEFGSSSRSDFVEVSGNKYENQELLETNDV